MIFGGKTAQARTVLVYGNCQAPYLAQLLGEIDDLNDDYRFVAAINHAVPGEELAPVADVHFRDVALCLAQYEKRADSPIALALRSRLPPGCPVITFPSFVMNSFWPFDCPEPRGLPDPAYPWKRYPFGDMIGLRIAQAGLAGPLAVAAYLDHSLRKMPKLDVRLQRDIDRLHYYDARCDVKLADYVEANFRQHHLFWTEGHISQEGVVELARRVATAARPVLGGSAGRTEECLAATAFAGMGNLQLPIHPMVADALGLRFWESDMAYHWYSQEWTFYEYIERYIAFDTSW